MDDLTGQQIKDYQLEQRLGGGAFGAVYRAEKGKQQVALKVIDARLASDRAFRRRFLEQESALLALSHQAIVRVHELGEFRKHLYLVMDYIRGETMASLAGRNANFSLEIAVDLGRRLALALTYAHRQGVVHGGLHPAAIFLRPVGGASPWQPRITDFALLTLLDEIPATHWAYTAPEQAGGRRVDGRSDVYSLGAILYELVTGQLPFRPGSQAEAAAIRPTPSPRSLRPEISTTLERVILRAVARAIPDRYRSMEEFSSALRLDAAVLTGSPAADEVPFDPHKTQKPAPPPKPRRKTGSQEAILISHPDREVQQFHVGQQWLITIGQMEGNDLVLPAEGVTAKHARLEREESGWIVVDMNSRSGTFLDNSRLLPDVPQPWDADQELEIGPYTLRWGDGQALARYEPEKPVVVAPPPQRGVAIRVTPAQVTIRPGEPAGHLVVDLENQSDQKQSIQLGVEGLPGDWIALEERPIQLLPGQKARLPLAITAPPHPDTTAGPHNYRIVARPERTGEPDATAPGQAIVAPFRQLAWSLEPPLLTHGRPGQVTLTNMGNVATDYSVTATDVADALTFNPPGTPVTVTPGETAELPLTAKGRKRAWLVKRRLAAFELEATDGERTYALPGRLLIPPRLSLAPLLALLLLLVGGALYFGRASLCQLEDIALLRKYQMNWAFLCDGPATTLGGLATPTPTPTVTPGAIAIATAAPFSSPTPSPTALPTEPLVVEPERIVIGTSVNGTPIEAIRFGTGARPVVFVGGVRAGYAPASVTLAQSVVASYRNDPAAVDALPASVSLYIIPNMNPDSGRSPGDVAAILNANGVDLNRNWPCRWRIRDGDEGTAPLSEPESRAVHDFIVAEVSAAFAVFWNTPDAARFEGLVSPGRCTAGDTEASFNLATAYADAAPGFVAQQADVESVLIGDATDSLAAAGVPAIYVLLRELEVADVNEHLDAVAAVLALAAGDE